MKSCLSSPLIINYLLSLYGGGVQFQKQYVQIYNSLKSKKPFKFRNKLFLPRAHNVEKHLKTSDSENEIVQFENLKDTSQIIRNWINQYEVFKKVDIDKYVTPNTTSLLMNISEYKGTWNSNGLSPVMKVHNSFTYTEDIKYEARLLELPMQEDFKLAVIVPNEVDSLHALFNTLSTEGLDAAIRCVQPLFTHTTVLEAPSIEFGFEGQVLSETGKCDIYNGVQLGNVQINENGANISMLTCLGFTYKNPSEFIGEELLKNEMVYYFAVVYKDTAIFTGRYVKEIK